MVVGALSHSLKSSELLRGLDTHVLVPLGQIFLRMIFMVVVPMVFSALVLGVLELSKGGGAEGLGRVARRTLFYTVLASAASVMVGISFVNLFKPGAGFPVDMSVGGDAAKVVQLTENASQAKGFGESLVALLPKNPLDSAVRALDGEMIPLMVFALIFAVALGEVTRRRRQDGPSSLVETLEEIFETCMKVVGYAMKIAPFAVFAIVFHTAFSHGIGVFANLLYFVVVVVAGLAFQQFVVYTILLKTQTKWNPWKFYHQCRDVYLYAFATASSNATLPRTLELAENELKLPSRISRFVLTVGSTANQNGTALFEGMTVLFLAQVYQIDLTLGQQVQVVLMSILAGIGTAGVPGGSLPLIVVLLQQVGIPAEGIGLVLGVDRFLDMCRTTLNVSGDLVIAALVSEKEVG
jgi:DAACS family dicarboxylate/amino acid:cation (Na+ or H+) symporter